MPLHWVPNARPFVLEVHLVKRSLAPLVSTTLVAALVQLAGPDSAGAAPTASLDVNRSVEAVVMTGRQLPSWSTTPAQGVANPYPCGRGDGQSGRPSPPQQAQQKTGCSGRTPAPPRRATPRPQRGRSRPTRASRDSGRDRRSSSPTR